MSEAESGSIAVKEQPTSIETMNDEQKATFGHALEQEIVDDSRQVMARYLRIGRNLHIVSKNKLYEQLGYETFESWRAQPEISLSRATSYALMKVFEVFIERLKVDADRLAGVDYTKLYNISQFVTAENVDEFLTKVKSLSRSDLQREIAIIRAQKQGKTVAQAEESVATLDIVREACPINCGAKCGLIDADHDVAVEAFKKYLGKFKSLSARIKGLFGTQVGKKAKSVSESEAEQEVGPDEAVLPEIDSTVAPGGSESHIPGRDSEEPGDGQGVSLSDFDTGGDVLEGERKPSSEVPAKRIWP